MRAGYSERLGLAIALPLLLLSFFHLSRNAELVVAHDLIAAGVVSTVSVDCTDPTPTAFMPDIAYTITWSAPSSSSAATPSATGALTGPINSDENPLVTATLNGTGVTAGFVLLTNKTPLVKIGGIQCQSYGEAKLEANGDGSNNTSFDIAVSNMADPDTDYTASDEVDDALSGAKDVLWGAGGQIATSNLVDGSDQDSASPNGDIVWGGPEDQGGSKMHSVIDVTNYDVQAATDVETLTFTISPQ